MIGPDFNGIGEALAALIQANIPGYKTVIFEPDQIQTNALTTPGCYIYQVDGDSDARTGQSYLDKFVFEIEIETANMASWKSASILRNDLFRLTRDLIRRNPRFHVDLESTLLGHYEFERSTDVAGGSFFAALARFEITMIVYNDF